MTGMDVDPLHVTHLSKWGNYAAIVIWLAVALVYWRYQRYKL